MKTFAQYIAEQNFHMTLKRGSDFDTLKVTKGKDKKWIEVRGKSNYETSGYDKKDSLHQFLDKLDPATVAKLMDGSEVYLNPNNRRTTPAIKQAEKLFEAAAHVPRKKYPSDDSQYQKKMWRQRPHDIKRRGERNTARRKAEREGLCKKGDGKEVHHLNPDGKKGSLGDQVAVISKAENRSIGHPHDKGGTTLDTNSL